MTKKMEQRAVDIPVDAGLWKRVLKWEDAPVLILSLRYPKLPEDRAGLRRVGRCYRRAADLWKTRWEGKLYRDACAAAEAAQAEGRPFQPWEAKLDYTVTLQREGLLSLYMDAWEYAGGAHGLTVRHADTWEPRSGTVRPLASFFPPRSHWRRQVLESLYTQAEARVAAGETLYFDDWPARLQGAFNPERFYLTEEGIAIFYPLYTIAPYAEGIPVFQIPYPGVKDDGTPSEKS